MYRAENYLNCSNANTKWFVALTDGCIGDVGTQNQILTRMKRDKITVGKLNLSGGYGGYDSDSSYAYDETYDHVLNIKDGDSNADIVTFFKGIYDVSMARIGEHG